MIYIQSKDETQNNTRLPTTEQHSDPSSPCLQEIGREAHHVKMWARLESMQSRWPLHCCAMIESSGLGKVVINMNAGW